jgi:hypothetical protein
MNELDGDLKIEELELEVSSTDSTALLLMSWDPG